MATHCSIFAWRIPWTEETRGYSLWGPKESDIVIEHNLITVHVSLIEPFSSSSMLVSSKHLLCWFQLRGE